MKNTPLKKPSGGALLVHLLSLSLLLMSPASSNAQTFIAATQTEYYYPPFPGPVTTTTHSFAYTISHICFMTNNPTPPPVYPYTMGAPALPQSDLTIHTWDDAGVPGGIAYLNTATGSGTPAPPLSIYDQGFIPYPDCRSIEVSLMQDANGAMTYPYGTTAPWYVIVSYYYTGLPGALHPGGPGHYMDQYIWNQPFPNGPGGMTWVSTTQLSTVAAYTRISQDGHNTYGFCITWENPNTGIDFVFGYMPKAMPGGPLVSPVYNVAGTIGQKSPDVAFTHSGSGGLNAQFLYYKFTGNLLRITESQIPFQYAPPWLPAAPPPTINDINTFQVRCENMDIKTRIDASDHWTDDWAYTFTLPLACGMPNKDIHVRYNNGGVKTNYVVNDGTMGNLRCDQDLSGPYLNDWPVCSFDATTNWLNVEWYTQYQTPTGFYAPNVGGYVGVRMDNLGNIISTWDYLQVGEAASLSNTLASYTPTIASSRQNDRTDYQFTAMANLDPAGSGGNEMVVKDRVWTSGTFKGGSAVHDMSELYPNAVSVPTPNYVSAFPNPFNDKVILNFSASLLDKDMSITVTDITGRVINKTTGKGNTMNEVISNISHTLNNGTYLLKVQTTSGDYSKVLKIQKIGTN